MEFLVFFLHFYHLLQTFTSYLKADIAENTHSKQFNSVYCSLFDLYSKYT